MPTNRTRRKRSKQDLDQHKLSELHHGPGTCLLAGCGYFMHPDWPGAVPGNQTGFYWELSDENQAMVREAMLSDWRLYRDEVMAAWDGEGDPWALTEFGEIT
ncbi:hypothetical protein K3152_13485 [Qipengyuania sp. 1NDH17]|uniref:Uncharacterized protein n=1 Tax=Qipengyuania polymorpha TaxID=2867234 RepID=A0ABS7J0A6_9SPHN|nr:hypothetical protein [Qipengyuania polymorpha]MBX7459260.1 hypothetical protein [Qipengyuania polymorpha]